MTYVLMLYTHICFDITYFRSEFDHSEFYISHFKHYIYTLYTYISILLQTVVGL